MRHYFLLWSKMVNVHFKKKLICLLIFISIITQTKILYAQEAIAIVPFELNAADNQNKINLTLHDRIQDKLVASKAIVVIERANISSILDETKMAQSGLIDDETAIKAGKLIGADLMLFGNIGVTQQNRYHISSRLVEIEAGKVIKQWTGTDLQKKEIQNYINVVSADIIHIAKRKKALSNIASIENTNQTFSVEMETKRDTYAFGEVFDLVIKPQKSSFIYVFDVGTSGNIHLLFPNRLQMDNHIQESDSIVIQNLRVGPPEGVEMIKTIATRDSITIRELIDIAGSSATFYAYEQGPEAFSRDLQLLVSPIKQDRWSTATIKLHILKK